MPSICLVGVSGVVHGSVFASLSFGGSVMCSEWSWVRIFDFLDVSGCVFHCHRFESLICWDQSSWCSAWPWVRIFDF
jgi:hypothetical protein